MEKKHKKLQVVSSRPGSIIRLLEAQVVAAVTSLQDAKFAEEDEASLGKDKVSSFFYPDKSFENLSRFTFLTLI